MCLFVVIEISAEKCSCSAYEGVIYLLCRTLQINSYLNLQSASCPKSDVRIAVCAFEAVKTWDGSQREFCEVKCTDLFGVTNHNSLEECLHGLKEIHFVFGVHQSRSILSVFPQTLRMFWRIAYLLVRLHCDYIGHCFIFIFYFSLILHFMCSFQI